MDNQEEVNILKGIFDSTPEPPPPCPPPSLSLGQSLTEHRRAHHLTTKRLALQLGVSHETLLRWQADVELPSADEVIRICDVLGTSPPKTLRLVRESARRALAQTLRHAVSLPRALAARQRGTAGTDADEVLVAQLPAPLRRGLAGHVGTAEVPVLAAALRKLAAAPPGEQQVVTDALAASLMLEGE